MAIVLGALVVWASRLDTRALAHIVAHARLDALGGVVLLMLVAQALRVGTLRALVGSVDVPGAYLALLSGWLLGTATPMRVGELGTIWLLERHAGLNWRQAVIAAVGERGLQLLTLVLFLAPVAALLGQSLRGLVPANAPAVGMALALCILGVATVFWLRLRKTDAPGRPLDWRVTLRELLLSPRRLLVGCAWSLGFWGVNCLAARLCLVAVGAKLAWLPLAFTVLVSALAGALIALPGAVSADVLAAVSYRQFGLSDQHVFVLFTVGLLIRNVTCLAAGLLAGAALVRRRLRARPLGGARA